MIFSNYLSEEKTSSLLNINQDPKSPEQTDKHLISCPFAFMFVRELSVRKNVPVDFNASAI